MTSFGVFTEGAGFWVGVWRLWEGQGVEMAQVVMYIPVGGAAVGGVQFQAEQVRGRGLWNLGVKSFGMFLGGGRG